MVDLEKVFNITKNSKTKETLTSEKYNLLQLAKMSKKTENGDNSFNTTGNSLLDILFSTEYYRNHTDELKIGTSDKEKLFSRFIRDPRYGIGAKNVGRELMKQAGISPEEVVKSGRFDDLLFNPTNENIEYLKQQVESGNELAKKWAPRISANKDRAVGKMLAKMWNLTEKEYRKLIKTATTEQKLSLHNEDDIKFEQVPSLAAIKYAATFARNPKLAERYKAYKEAVKKGEVKLNVSTTTVVDILENMSTIDAQMFFDKLPKISGSFLPVLDVSGSMGYGKGSIRNKAQAVAHYLSKCSTYCKDQLITFSENPKLITMGVSAGRFKLDQNTSQYINEMSSIYVQSEVANTDFGKVCKLLKEVGSAPEWIVCLSDMEFDSGSSTKKDDMMSLFKRNGFNTKIVWWNFNDRGKTFCETDEYQNIFLSGYSPFLLSYLEGGFDGEKFLNKLLEEYSKKIK